MPRHRFLCFSLASIGITLGGVAFAQGAPTAPNLPPPPVTEKATESAKESDDTEEVPSNKARVSLTANLPQITFYMDGGDALCTAPCRAVLTKGTHRIAVSHANQKPIEPDEFVAIGQPSRIETTYTSYLGTRVVGYAIGVAGLGVASILIGTVVSRRGTCEPSMGDHCEREVGTGSLVAAGIIGGVSLITALILISVSDSVSVNVVPEVFSRPRQERGRLAQGHALVGGGLALQVAF